MTWADCLCPLKNEFEGSHRRWAISLPGRTHVLNVFACKRGSVWATGYIAPLFIRDRKILIGWAFDIRRVRRFAGFLCLVFAPTPSGVELDAQDVSHIARSKLYAASPAPSSRGPAAASPALSGRGYA
jgi:hypothetical protein